MPAYPGGPPPAPDEKNLVQALRRGDESTFEELVKRYYPQMLRVATMYVQSRAVAEEVVQDAWVGVLRGIERFEERSSLKTWVFRILTNTAKTRAVREGRSIPFSDVWDAGLDQDEPAVDPERFLGTDHPALARHWARKPVAWGADPEALLESAEIRKCIEDAIATLPMNQRNVIELRDIAGWEAEEVCQLLGISDANQRVLLHRARSKVRNACEAFIQGS